METILDSVISRHKIGKHDLRKKSLSLDIVNKYSTHIPLFVRNKSVVWWGKGGGLCARQDYNTSPTI